MHTEVGKELSDQETKNGEIQPDQAEKLIELIIAQTETERQQNPQDYPYHWLEMLRIIKDRGFTQMELDQILNLQQPRGRVIDPLTIAASRIHYGIHSARLIRSKIYSKQPIDDNLQFLIPAITTKGGLFNFVQAGCFVLEDAEAKSKLWYKSKDFRSTVDEISLSLYQSNFPFYEV